MGPDWAGLSATLVVPVSSTEKPRISPCTAKSVPSVTIKDGTTVLMTRKPLISPTSTPRPSAPMMPSQIGMP